MAHLEFDSLASSSSSSTILHMSVWMASCFISYKLIV
jgi:hypothetical protein